MTLTSTELLETALPDLHSHFHDEVPNEAVGLLLRNGCVVRLRNQAASPKRFFISGSQLETKLRERQINPDDIYAVYHTHPELPPEPSGEDRRFMVELAALWPWVAHLILSRDETAVYAVVDGEIVRILFWRHSHSQQVN